MRKNFNQRIVDEDAIRRARISLIMVGVFFAAVGVFFRVVQLQAREHGSWNKMALKQSSAAIEIQGARGSIFDREGRPLAVSVEGAAIGGRLRLIENTALKTISDTLALPLPELKGKLASGSRFAWLGRGVPRIQSEEVKRLKGIEIFPEFYRHYPQGDLARGILGQVSLDGKGIAGIELQFEEALKAGKERINVQRDARGKFIDGPELSSIGDLFNGDLVESAVATENVSEARKIRDEGGDINLSIDSALQGILEEELALGLGVAKAKRVIGVVMRAETGELLALGQALRETKRENSRYLSPDELRNSLIHDIFEPGSTFKPLVAALAMDAGKVTPNELINCENGNYPVGKYVVHDVHPVATVPMSEVLVRSSNIGTAKIGTRLGKEGLKSGIQSLGFGVETGIELPGEQKGLLQKGSWGAIQMATNSFGQGISVTAIQLVRAYAALANGGKLVVPTILKVEDPGSLKANRVFTEKTSKAITDILVGVTEDEEGTGKKAALDGLQVSGKTGTAQKARTHGRGYESDKVFASFIGYVDSSKLGQKEHLVMFVGVDEPGVYPRWGGVVAAPIFRKTMERVLAHQMVR